MLAFSAEPLLKPHPCGRASSTPRLNAPLVQKLRQQDCGRSGIDAGNLGPHALHSTLS